MSRLIDEIKLPEALKKLSSKQLQQVAEEVRSEIIDVTSKTGGHVAGSLGAVELAVALHSSFESPRDKIIWDVGHQSYAHKILTGRKESFKTLRQYKGLSGFPNIEESPHDVFTVGHASTSISQAVGLVHARDIKGENYSVVAVIGDGSISGGLAFEGMNNAGSVKKNLIVVLNDNEMSISKNVGALSNYLTAVKTSDFYVDIRDRIEKLIKRLPQGAPLLEVVKKLKDRTRHIVMSFKVDVIFEEFGFTYFGPIDGHNIPLLMSTFHHAKEVQGPVLIHILTKKGKGFKPAEADPTRFHGVGPYDSLTGKITRGENKNPSYTEVFGKTMVRIAETNKDIVAVTAAMVDGTGLDDFAKQYPKRFFDVGIAEEYAVTFAGALARGGVRPVVAIYSTFLQRAYDEILHDVCLQNLPVIFAVDRAGIVGEDGATHNGAFDIAYLRSMPNMVVMSPADENELQHMLFSATQMNQPVAIRYPRGEGVGVPMDKDLMNIAIGKGEIAFQGPLGDPKAKICTIFAIGPIVHDAIQAAKTLIRSGIVTNVINCKFVKPLDNDLILYHTSRSNVIVTLEEGTLVGGFGSAVVELLADAKMEVPMLRLGLPDKFVEHGKRETIMESLGLSSDQIADRIEKWIKAL